MGNVVAAQLLNAASLTVAISPEHFSCLRHHSANEALQTNITPAQAWLRTSGGLGGGSGSKTKASLGTSLGFRKAFLPAILTNPIDGAFNCVVYRCLIEVMTLIKLQRYLTQWVASSGASRFTSFAFIGHVETPQPFNTGIPQSSPLSPILFVIYSSAITPFGPLPPVAATTTFVLDIGLLRGARSSTEVFVPLQDVLDFWLAWAPLLTIQLAIAKAAIIHLVPVFSNIATPMPPMPVQVGVLTIAATRAPKILRVLVDD